MSCHLRSRFAEARVVGAVGHVEGAGREEVGAADRAEVAVQVDRAADHAEGAVWGAACRQGAAQEEAPRGAFREVRPRWEWEEVAQAPAQGESAGPRAAPAFALASEQEAQALVRAQVWGDRRAGLAFALAPAREVWALGPAQAWAGRPVVLAFAPA